jgi:hypothetical protein
MGRDSAARRPTGNIRQRGTPSKSVCSPAPTGHGGGEATTLRVNAAWVAAAGRKAAEILASHMSKRPQSRVTSPPNRRQPAARQNHWRRRAASL